MERVDCVIAGCGPAGAVLGLLLARAGLRVTVVEKHGDFLRDFRGDTIHASTLTLLDELGLGDEFARLDQQRITELHVAAGDREWPLADFRHLPGRHREIALMPQWAIHRRIVAPLLDGGATPPPVRVLERFPALQAIPAYLLAVGIRPEHARRQPRWAPR